MAEDYFGDLVEPSAGSVELNALSYGPIVGEFHRDAVTGPDGKLLRPNEVALSPNQQKRFPNGTWLLVDNKPMRVSDSSFYHPGNPTSDTIEFRDRKIDGKVRVQGLFDDLATPQEKPTTKGLFDDLIPEQPRGLPVEQVEGSLEHEQMLRSEARVPFPRPGTEAPTVDPWHPPLLPPETRDIGTRSLAEAYSTGGMLGAGTYLASMPELPGIRKAAQAIVDAPMFPSIIKENPVFKGSKEALVDTVAALSAPQNLALMASGAALPGAAGKAVTAWFVGKMAAQFPDQWKEFKSTTDPEERTKLLVEMGLQAGIIAGGMRSLRSSRTVPSGESLKMEDFLPKTEGGIADTTTAEVKVSGAIATGKIELGNVEAVKWKKNLERQRDSLQEQSDQLRQAGVGVPMLVQDQLDLVNTELAKGYRTPVQLEGERTKLDTQIRSAAERAEPVDVKRANQLQMIEAQIPAPKEAQDLWTDAKKKLVEAGQRDETQVAIPVLPESAFPPVGLQLGIVPGLSQLYRLGKDLNLRRKSFLTYFRGRPTRDRVTSTYDAMRTKTDLAGEKAGNDVRLFADLPKERGQMDRQAMIPIIESLGDKENLRAQVEQVFQSPKSLPEFKRAYGHALQNFDRLSPKSPVINAIHEAQLQAERAHGFDTDRLEGYVEQVYDQDLMIPGRAFIMAGSTRSPGTRFFLKQRTFQNHAEAIAAGMRPRNFDIVDAVSHRIRAGQNLINQKLWLDALRTEISPIDNLPVVTDALRQQKGTYVAPPGYQLRQYFTGQTVAINDLYAPIMDALTAESHFPPVLKNIEGELKHGILLLDSFHGSRLGQMQLAFMGNIGYQQGLSLIEYSDRALGEALKKNEITTDQVEYAKKYRPQFESLVDHGMNVSKINDALWKDAVEGVPSLRGLVSPYTKFLFDKLNRGIIAESGIYALERNKNLHPEWSDRELTRQSAKEVNIWYRNLRSQGIFKRKTWQDMARFLFLAPQWTEGGITTELTVAGQALRVPYDLVAHRKLVIGNVLKAQGTGILAYAAVAQIANMITRGHPTWDNKEEGHRWDAWMPDVLGSSKGFFISPMSVFGEMTHDVIKYSELQPTEIDAFSRIAQNKFSPVTRAGRDLLYGKDYFGQPLNTTWDRVKQAAIDLTPAPIGSRPFVGLQSEYPGEKQKTLMSTVGLKADISPSATQQMYRMADRFNREKGIPKPELPPSQYGTLRRALQMGNMKIAQSEYDKLRKTRSEALIHKHFFEKMRLFTRAKMEGQFVKWLSPDQKELYREAGKEHLEIKQRFVQLEKMVRASKKSDKNKSNTEDQNDASEE